MDWKPYTVSDSIYIKFKKKEESGYPSGLMVGRMENEVFWVQIMVCFLIWVYIPHRSQHFLKKVLKLYTWLVYFPVSILYSNNKLTSNHFPKIYVQVILNTGNHNDIQFNISFGKSFVNIPTFSKEQKQFPL